jgi:hypothetical protein
VQVRRHAENRSRDREIAALGQDHSSRKQQRMIGLRKRLLLPGQATRNGVALATTDAARGDLGPMWQAPLRSLTSSWTRPAWSLGLRIPLRPHAPERRVEIHRRCCRPGKLS